MCCSIRGAVFFLASVHIFFSITQMVYILPVAVSRLGDKVLESSMAFLFCLLFFATGFMTFRGADEESATLVRLGAFCLFIVIVFRFVLMGLGLMLVDSIPEASFLYVYGTSVIPIAFTILLYMLYLAILFCYYKDLRHESSAAAEAAAAASAGIGSSLSLGHGRNISGPPFNFQCSPPAPAHRPHLRPQHSTLLPTLNPTSMLLLRE